MALDVSFSPINNAADEWSREAVDTLLGSIEQLNILNEYGLWKSVRYRIRTSYGVAERIGFGFKRYGVYVEKGVGRGRPIGSTKAKQKARPWFNPRMDELLPVLAEKMGEAAADVIIKGMKIN